MNEKLETRLLQLAAVFLILYAGILALSPAVRERSLDVQLRWGHWAAVVAWAVVFFLVRGALRARLPLRDPYLLPIVALLTGWGVLTIWRLTPEFGLRQTAWMLVGGVVLVTILRSPLELDLLRRYKYLLLSLGLGLTALTIVFGTNPEGSGPRLWLGCCGIYLQPSEPLKLLLISYLAAYLADRLPARNRLIPLLLPTLVVTGLALLLLLFQRDLGTASIFILLYAAIVFLGTGHRRVLAISSGLLLLAGTAGYLLIDLIRLRIDAWLNPWLDPSGRSYQIIQSLLAIANGGVLGRGPGLGSPTLVPIAHSDFIFTAIAEETGLAGTLGLLALLSLLATRGTSIAMRATGRFQRLLGAGIAAYFTIQSLLIIGGNLRVLPLTGVTLPFVSYGGSSLLTAFLAALALLIISGSVDQDPAPLPDASGYLLFHTLVSIGMAVMALGAGWWVLYRGGDLLTRTDNARRSIADRYVRRGTLYDRDNLPLNTTTGQTGGFTRRYLYPGLAPVTGYTHPVYGQAGLEASLDEYLRGLQGNPASLIWWDRLLYGTPPPGVDVRLSLDLQLQVRADELLGAQRGALVLVNAESGEVLVMASHPGYDPNQLDSQGERLAADERAPLLNRATLGSYPAGVAMGPFFEILAGVPSPATDEQARQVYQALGFLQAPAIRMPVSAGRVQDGRLSVSPLHMAIAAAALSSDGLRPAPRIVLAAETPQEGWVILPPPGDGTRLFPSGTADSVLSTLSVDNVFWGYTAASRQEGVTWHLGGTYPTWKGSPLALALVLEEANPARAASIAASLLRTASAP